MKIWTYSQSHRIDGKGKCVDEANRYFEMAEVQGLSMDTVRSYAFTLMAFFRWIKEDWKRVEELNQRDLQDWMVYLKQLEFKPRSINQMLVCVRGFYRFLYCKSVPHAPGGSADFHGARFRRFAGGPGPGLASFDGVHLKNCT